MPPLCSPRAVAWPPHSRAAQLREIDTWFVRWRIEARVLRHQLFLAEAEEDAVAAVEA